jgi:hypothetical protein
MVEKMAELGVKSTAKIKLISLPFEGFMASESKKL